jgi:DNA-binding beta-propeller fold protein YncE
MIYMNHINAKKASRTVLAAAMTVIAAGSLTIVAQPALAVTVCVGGGHGCYATIQAAVNAAQDGNTIVIENSAITGNLATGSDLAGEAESVDAAMSTGGSPLAAGSSKVPGPVARRAMPTARLGAGRLPFVPSGRLREAGLAWARPADAVGAPGVDPADAQHGLFAATVATTPVGTGPVAAAVNQATNTIYVANDGPGANGTGTTVSVIDGRTCRAADLSRCRHRSPTVTVGSNPSDLAVDQATDTIYVTNANSNTVSVINGATCNSQVRSGCTQTPPQVPVGGTPFAVTVDQANHTAYVVNAATDNVSMINTATCNASRLSGCSGQHPPTAAVGTGPAWAAVDQTTRTVYVANDNAVGSPTFNDGSTVSVFGASACNATTQAGCARQGLITVGTGPIAIAVDEGTDTVYTANIGANTVSVIDGRTCDSSDLAGCAAQTPGTVTVGQAPNAAGLDSSAHTLYVSNTDDDTLSVIDTTVCNGRRRPACSHLVAPTVQAGGAPTAAAVNPATNTLYVPNAIDDDASVIDATKCDATDTAGCRHPAPSVAQGEYLLSADPATNTVYASNLSKPQIDVINAATCHARQLSGCAPVAAIPMPDPQANVGAIDQATHTLYASDESPAGTLAVINTATCNATHTAGCAAAPTMVRIGAFPNVPVLNPATHTVYVSYGNTANRIAVVNTATCNATNTSGCSQAPAVVKVKQGTIGLAVSAATDTLYAPASGPGFSFSGDTVAVINGATCNATNTSGCGHPAATATVGLGPFGLAINDRTHTVYVANNANGNSPGTVSVINTATCNATITTGCHQRFPVVPTGRSPVLVAVDTSTGTVYATDLSSATVTILNGRRCNAVVTSGCRQASREQAAGSQPFGLAINPRTGTVYVSQLFQAGSLSIFPATRR